MKLEEFLQKSPGISTYMAICTDNKDKTDDVLNRVLGHLYKLYPGLTSAKSPMEELGSPETAAKIPVKEVYCMLGMPMEQLETIDKQRYKMSFAELLDNAKKIVANTVEIVADEKTIIGIVVPKIQLDELKNAIVAIEKQQALAEFDEKAAIGELRRKLALILKSVKSGPRPATPEDRTTPSAKAEEQAAFERLEISLDNFAKDLPSMLKQKPQLNKPNEKPSREDFLPFFPEVNRVYVFTNLNRFVEAAQGRDAAYMNAFIDALAKFRKDSFVILLDTAVAIQQFLEKYSQLQSLFGKNIIAPLPYTDEEFCDYYFRLAENYNLNFLYKGTQKAAYAKDLKLNREVLERTTGYKGKHLAEYLVDCAKRKKEFTLPLEEEPLAKLQKKIGLNAVKAKFKEMTEVLQYDVKAKQLGRSVSTAHGNMHMVFMGNPGTGKTTVAKMVAEILANAGIIKENKIVTMTKTDISTSFMNESQRMMRRKINEAMGGILFIDEAYTLTPSKTAHGWDPMKDVIQELLDAMNTYREEFIVIFAGYTNEMKKFLESNAGLASRIGFTFNFEDYTADELTEMFMAKVKENNLYIPQILDNAYADLLQEASEALVDEDDEEEQGNRDLSKAERKQRQWKKLHKNEQTQEEIQQELDEELAQEYGFAADGKVEEPKLAKLQFEDAIRNIMRYFRGMKNFGNGRFVETLFVLMYEKHKYNAIKGKLHDIGIYEEEAFMNLFNQEKDYPANAAVSGVYPPYVVCRHGDFSGFFYRNEESKLSDDYPALLCLHPKDIPTIPEIVAKLANKEDFSLNPNKDIWETDELDFLNKIKQKKRFRKMQDNLVSFYLQEKYNQKTAEANLKIGKHNRHMLFTGDPGTGKTTIANIIAEALAQIGVISMPKCITADRNKLVGDELDKEGKSVSKISKVLDDAMGGILFIDEAYDLVHGPGDAMGQTAVAELIKAMEDHRDDLIVILAGYENSMAEFLKSNEGLRSRIGYTFHFDNFEPDALMDIFQEMLKANGYKISKNVLNNNVKPIMDYFYLLPNFGNGRFVEKIYNMCMTKHALRIVKAASQEFSLSPAQIAYLLKDEENSAKKVMEELNAVRKYSMQSQLDLYHLMQHLSAEDIPSIKEVISVMPDNNNMTIPEDVLPEDVKRVAYHELGHAVVSFSLGKAVPKRITCKASAGGALGYVEHSPEDFRNVQIPSKQYFLDDICISLGGLASEQHFLGEYTSGGGSDLPRAREDAGTIIRCGFSSLGLLYAGIPTMAPNGNLSLMTIPECKDEINKLIQQQFGRTLEIIANNQQLIEKLVDQVVKDKFIEGKDIVKLFGNIKDKVKKG